MDTSTFYVILLSKSITTSNMDILIDVDLVLSSNIGLAKPICFLQCTVTGYMRNGFDLFAAYDVLSSFIF